MSKCPLGIEHDRKCPNYYDCQKLCDSWLIPYSRVNGVLCVLPCGYAIRWHEYEYPRNNIPRCAIDPDMGYCGYYKHRDDPYLCDRITNEWLAAGWCAAVDLSSKPPPPSSESDFDDIPF